MILTHDGESIQHGTMAFENKHGVSCIYGLTHNIRHFL
jgi:hypothetical protein